MAHILKYFVIVISFLVMSSSCGNDSLSDIVEDEAPKILYDSDERYFHVSAIRDVNLAESLWVNMEYIEKLDLSRKWQPAYDDMNEPTLRFLESLELSFNFPFYGFLTNYVTFDIDGRICMKKIIFLNEECQSFVAPLGMKLSFRKDESYIKYIDTGRSLVVQWGNVDLYPPFYLEEQNVTMQVTLFQNGTIEFVYKQILTSLFVLFHEEYFKTLVNIGTRDSKGCKFDKIVRNNIFIVSNVDIGNDDDHIYGVIALQERLNNDFDIKNGTVIKFLPLPTCNWFNSCELCTQTQIYFKCAWCPQIKRCSNYGNDGYYYTWFSSGCVQNYVSSSDVCRKV